MAVSKAFLVKREEELTKAISQLEEQYNWCKERGLGDLCNAYTAGLSLTLSRLEEIQNMIKDSNHE